MRSLLYNKNKNFRAQLYGSHIGRTHSHICCVADIFKVNKKENPSMLPKNTHKHKRQIQRVEKKRTRARLHIISVNLYVRTLCIYFYSSSLHHFFFLFSFVHSFVCLYNIHFYGHDILFCKSYSIFIIRFYCSAFK